MIANRNYAYDLSVPESIPEVLPKQKEFKVIKTLKKQNEQDTLNITKNKKMSSKLSLILSVTAMFAMFIVLSYRYNAISEKNLMLQRLKMEQTDVESILATTEIAVEQVIDKDAVESYAKQQLGMQKPEKNQMIYINSDYETQVEQVAKINVLTSAIQKIKNIMGM